MCVCERERERESERERCLLLQMPFPPSSGPWKQLFSGSFKVKSRALLFYVGLALVHFKIIAFFIRACEWNVTPRIWLASNIYFLAGVYFALLDLLGTVLS